MATTTTDTTSTASASPDTDTAILAGVHRALAAGDMVPFDGADDDAALLAGIDRALAQGYMVTFGTDVDEDADEEVATSEYRLSAGELNATRAKIAAVNKRCRRLGVPEVTITSTPVPVWVRYSHTGRLESTDPQPAPWFRITMHDVTIAGGRPRLAGHELLALVEFLSGGSVVRTVPGLDAAAVDRDTLVPGRCDHCGIDRGRVRVYLVAQAATGRILQVGTSCARDYLGLSVSPVFDDCTPSRDEDSGAGGAADAPAVVALAAAVADVRSRGFVPSSAHDRLTTRDVLTATLWPVSKADEERALPMATVDAHIAEAEQILAHFAAAEATGDFEFNLRAIARSEWITAREAGLVAAMPTAYDRAIGRVQAQEARDAERARSQYIGTVGQRLQVTGTVRQVIELDAYAYGGPEPRLIVIATAEGNLVTWKTTAAIRSQIEPGQTLTLDGPVKAHEDRGYGLQTALGGKGGRVKASILAA